MIVVCACNNVAPRYAGKERAFCHRCGVAIVVLLTVEENKERVSRGVSLEQWFAAPKVPETRAACEDRDGACPYLRCRNNLGLPGAFGCAINVAEDAPTSTEEKFHHTLDHVGKHMGIGKERVRQIESAAFALVRLRTKRYA